MINRRVTKSTIEQTQTDDKTEVKETIEETTQVGVITEQKKTHRIVTIDGKRTLQKIED